MFERIVVILSFLICLQIARCEKIIIDTDAGGDDAVAILLYLRYEAAHPESGLQIIGITCTYGNTKEENVEINVLKILTIAGRGDIPVYAGAKQGFIQPFSTDNYFGSDGFGDAEFDEKLITEINRTKIASTALVDMVKENAGNVSIISLAPLTNIALAIAADENFTKYIKKFYTMGTSVAGVGNKSPNVEFNIGADPESSFSFFNSTGESQVILMPWETVMNTDLSKDWRINVLGKYDSPYIKFLNKVEAVSLKTSRKQWVSADSVTVACLIEQSLIKRSTVKNVYIVTGGQGRGSALIDYNDSTDRIHNSKIVQDVHWKVFKKILFQYLTCQDIPC